MSKVEHGQQGVARLVPIEGKPGLYIYEGRRIDMSYRINQVLKEAMLSRAREELLGKKLISEPPLTSPDSKQV